MSLQRVGIEEWDAHSNVSLHLPSPDCGPRSSELAASAPERSGLLHQHAEGEGNKERKEVWCGLLCI